MELNNILRLTELKIISRIIKNNPRISSRTKNYVEL